MTLRAIKDPAARKLGVAVVEQNRQAAAAYKVEFDKLAPEFTQTRGYASVGAPAFARAGVSTEQPDGKALVMSTAVPESVRKRFLKVDGDYFFPDRSPAFVDRGAKLATRSEHPEVVRALVEIAKERGWDSVTVKASEAFRRATWMEAARNGMQIAGYKPTELDLAQLKQREANNSIEPGPVRDQTMVRPVPLAKSAEENSRIGHWKRGCRRSPVRDRLSW
ncbi:LPD7 domain-containing protein [Massilia sp. KIM]|uniref:LPD7 domain-containing protein n=1 Tax=Massilia sp. KIM TaxID=1955422 RepID=UPI00117F7F1F|nr:LPD7 domain-containing protein [Massilia sp. KIM]